MKESNQYIEPKVLIDLCIKGDKKAHELFYKQYYQSLMSIVHKYFKNPQIAEEVLHNAFIKIFKSLQSFSHKGSFEGWMKRITFHCVSDYVRANEKYLKKVQLKDEDYFFNQKSARTKDNLDFQKYMDIVASLDVKPRTVFMMYVIDELSHKEIAQVMDIPEGTSKWYLSQARKELQTKINYIQKYTTNGME